MEITVNIWRDCSWCITHISYRSNAQKLATEQVHDLRRRLAALRSEVQWHTSTSVSTHTTGSSASTNDLPFVQLRELAALVHTEMQHWGLGERELWVELIPVKLVDKVCRERGYLEQCVLGDLCARVENVDKRRTSTQQKTSSCS